MTPRIKNLLHMSQTTIPSISAERAQLITQFYQSGVAQHESVVVQRALAFRYLMENKSICILPEELIVGERGPAPKATPTYPEVCVHSQADLQTLNNRSKVPYQVDQQTSKLYEEQISPFWSGRSIREKIFHTWHLSGMQLIKQVCLPSFRSSVPRGILPWAIKSTTPALWI